MFFYLVLLLLIAMSGCQIGTRALPIELPSEALSNAMEEAASDPLIDEQSEQMPRAWWTLFQDEQLNQLIEQTFAHNPTLQAAEAHIRLAKAAASRVKAALYPNIIYGADVSRQKLSETGIIPFNKDTTGTAAAAVGSSSGAQPSTYGLPPGAGTPLPAQGGSNGIPVYFTQYEMEYGIDL